MPLEQRMDRSMFAAEELVHLKSHCFTPGRLFAPGTYPVEELPDTAFAMGLVESLPPVRGNSAEVRPDESNGSGGSDGSVEGDGNDAGADASTNDGGVEAE